MNDPRTITEKIFIEEELYKNRRKTEKVNRIHQHHVETNVKKYKGDASELNQRIAEHMSKSIEVERSPKSMIKLQAELDHSSAEQLVGFGARRYSNGKNSSK